MKKKLIAAAAGGVTAALALAVPALAGEPDDEMTRQQDMGPMHEQMMSDDSEMARMHEQMTDEHPDMAQMHEQMMGSNSTQD